MTLFTPQLVDSTGSAEKTAGERLVSNLLSYVCATVVISTGAFLSGCASGSAPEDDSGSSEESASVSDTDSSSDSSTSSVLRFSTNCGTVVQGQLVNPVSSADGELVRVVSVAGSNLVIVRRTAGPVQGEILVKLHGVGTASSREAQVIENLESIAQGDAYHIPAMSMGAEGQGSECTVGVNGGTAFTGQLFTTDGRSYSEYLLSTGASGEIDSGGSCGEAALSQCYTQIREANIERSAGQITDFLWKPHADSDFNAGSPVIHANPCDATVIVNGQPLMDFGPGNGRCNTSRMFQSCGSYGGNIKVEVIDNATGLPYYDGPNPFVTVPNGCSRYEFKR